MSQQGQARILLIGMGGTTPSALESLLAEFSVIGVVRDLSARTPSDEAVDKLARAAGVTVLDDVAASAVDELVARLRPDCVVVSSYNRILKEQTLARCRFVNVHYSPLPRYRGRANVNWALINDEPAAGISIHVLAPNLDAGNILFQRLIPVSANDTVGLLYERLNEIQREHLAATVVEFLDGFEGTAQDAAQASYGCTRVPDDGLIDWTASTLDIDRLVRGLADPFPGAFAYLNGARLRIWRAQPVADPPTFAGRIPGRVVAVSVSGGYADVLTGDGVLRILEVQLEGQNRVAAASLIRSVKCSLTLSVPELEARIGRLERMLETLLRERGGVPAGS
jgi:methionyl-tRNA formyltransferase